MISLVLVELLAGLLTLFLTECVVPIFQGGDLTILKVLRA